MLRTRLPRAYEAHRSAVAAGKLTPTGYLSVISGSGILLFLTLDTSYTMAQRFVEGVIWINIAYFVWEWLVKISHAARQRELRSYLLSAGGFIDLISAVAIPLAIAAGVERRTAFLLGVIWLLKIAPETAGFKQLRRVIAQEAEQLGSVMVIFALVLYAASVIVHVLERDAQPERFGTIHDTLWW